MPVHPPINPEVLRWAIDQSGYSAEDVANGLRVDPAIVRAWTAGEGGPTRGQLTALAKKLRRPKSIFFLRAPPSAGGLPPALRRAVGRTERELGANEILWVRRARRLQRLLSVVERGADSVPTAIPRLPSNEDPASAGSQLRSHLGVSIGEQFQWASPREAFEAWRDAVESFGVFVMELQLGSEGLRGFAISDDYVPVVAVNTRENMAARTFTLLHEVAHLASGTAQACLDVRVDAAQIERWCDEVAGAVVLPREALREALDGLAVDHETDFAAVQTIAERFKVSLRATAVALVRAGLAGPELYREVESQAPMADFQKGFGRGGARRAPRARLSEIGPRAARTVVAALSDNRLSEIDARRCLRLDGAELEALADEVGG